MNFYVRYRLLRLPWWDIGYYPDIEVRYVHFLKCNTCLILSSKQIQCKLTLSIFREQIICCFFILMDCIYRVGGVQIFTKGSPRPLYITAKRLLYSLFFFA